MRSRRCCWTWSENAGKKKKKIYCCSNFNCCHGGNSQWWSVTKKYATLASIRKCQRLHVISDNYWTLSGWRTTSPFLWSWWRKMSRTVDLSFCAVWLTALTPHTMRNSVIMSGSLCWSSTLRGASGGHSPTLLEVFQHDWKETPSPRSRHPGGTVSQLTCGAQVE